VTISNSTRNKLTAAGLFVAAAVVFGFWAAHLASTPATADQVGPTVRADAVSVAEARLFPALTKTTAGRHASLNRWETSSIARKFGANASLARAVDVPDRGVAYLIPGRDAKGGDVVCLYVSDPAGDAGTGASTCSTLGDVQELGGIHLQFISPSSASRTSPFPPKGTPFESTLVGIATADTTRVAATTENGAERRAAITGDGAFSIVGSGLRELTYGNRGGVEAAPLALG
jgi:hypothetical protein